MRLLCVRQSLFILVSIISISSCEKNSVNDKLVISDTIFLTDTIYAIDSILNFDTLFITDTVEKIIAPEDYDQLSVSAKTIYHLLSATYYDSCFNCLENMLQEWNKKYSPQETIADSLQDIYDVYREFYSPWNLARISDSEFGPNIYNGVKYYIIQQSISYNYDFRSYSGNYFTINDFRPVINNDTINILYAKKDYISALECFLGTGYLEFNEDNMIPTLPYEEINRRHNFLNKYLTFFHGHWGNYWHMETHPEVGSISFNKTKDSALVNFRLGYQGGEAVLGKENNKWIVVDHYMTWIEK